MKRHALLLLLSALLFCSGLDATAQTPPKLRVLVTECYNLTPQQEPGLGWTTTDAIYHEFATGGRERFTVISKQEAWAAAKRLGLLVPEETATEGHWTADEKLRLAEAIKADVIVQCDAGVRRSSERSFAFTNIYFIDPSTDKYVSEGSGIKTAKSIHQAMKEAVGAAIQDSIQHEPILSALVLTRGDNYVVLDHRVRGVTMPWARCIILREVADKKKVIGEVRLSDASAPYMEVKEETDHIRAGDIALVIYDI
ncbi:MAG TPA: DUF4136 domain-containing protein [Chthonomonadaceae bacterium]|nr:DUF4136 domain-containing protein [Chthonomonadaceae bacterium]